MNRLSNKLRNDSLSPEELGVLRKLLNTHSDDELAMLFPEITDSEQTPEDEKEIGEIVSNVKRRLDSCIVDDRDSHRFKSMRALAVAASIVAVLLLGGIITLWLTNRETPQSAIAFASGPDGTSFALLPDGSGVSMNRDSEIKLTPGFSSTRREADFRGEAYFEVAEDAEHPFMIHAPGMDVEVKGTSFNIFAVPDAACSEISLDKGSIRLVATGSSQAVTLKPGDCAIIDKATGRISVTAPGRKSSDWRNKEMYFNHSAPAYVFQRLNEAYGLSLDTLQLRNMKEEFTGVLPSDNLDEALGILENIYSVKIDRNQK